MMRTCEVCHNQYDKCFEINIQNNKYIFDCLECAIMLLAPECSHCKCRIIGHGVEKNSQFYCCANCAKEEGHLELKDRSDSGVE